MSSPLRPRSTEVVIKTRSLFRLAPLLTFTVVYLVTCVAGAIVVLEGDRTFAALYEYFSGAPTPSLTDDQRTTAIAVLLAPLAMWPGYLLAIAATRRLAARRNGRGARSGAAPPPWLAYAVFAAVATFALVALARAGAFATLDTWLDYGSWVQSRQQLFAQVDFASFVTIYTLVPLAAAWCALTPVGPAPLSFVWRLLPALVALGIALLLFQKKAAIVTLLIVFAAVLLASRERRPAHLGLRLGLAAAALAAIYFALVVLPVYSDTSRTVSAALEAAPRAQPSAGGGGGEPPAGETLPAQTAEQLEKLGREVQSWTSSRRRALVVYSLLAPVTRSSVPALYYPVVFPDVHERYRLDLGLDVLGYGTMPDDNVSVWHYMNPTIPGTVMVPFNFVLFSQVGVVGAFVGSFVVGLLLAFAWLACTSGRIARPWAPLLGSLVLLLSVYLAIDSLRNSLTVSYGVGWGFVFVALAAGATRFGHLAARGWQPLPRES